MVLRPLQVFGLERFGIQPFVNIAIKSQHGGSGIVIGELRCPGFVPIHIELGQGFAQVHQLGNLLRRFFLQRRNQLGRLRDKLRLAGIHRRQRGLVVKGFGR